MTGFGDESLGHCSSHVDPLSHVSEHEPVHVMWHVEPPLQSMLPLGPSVIEHVDVPAHLRLHEEPHAPVQSVLFSQSRVQLLGPQLLLVMSHVLPDGHVHVEPVQLGATPLLPQPADASSSADKPMTMYFIRRSYSRRVPHASATITKCSARSEHLHAQRSAHEDDAHSWAPGCGARLLNRLADATATRHAVAAVRCRRAGLAIIRAPHGHTARTGRRAARDVARLA